MSEENQETTDQTSYTDEAIDNWDNVEFLPQDGYIDDQNWRNNVEQTEKEEPDQKTEKTEQTETNVDQVFDFTTTNEKGESVLDTEKAMEFFKPQETKVEPPVKPVEKPQEEEKSTYEENLRTNLYSWRDYYKKYREAGFDEVSASMHADQAIEGDLSTHFNERRLNSLEEKYTAKEKAFEERAALAEARPKSQQNLTEAGVKNGWGNSQKLVTAILDSNLGGGLLTTMYKLANPDKKFTTAQEYSKALGDFLVKATADKEVLTSLEEYSRARLFMRNIRHFQAKAKETEDKVVTSKKAAKMGGNQATAKKQKPLSKEGKAMMEYLHEIERG